MQELLNQYNPPIKNLRLLATVLVLACFASCNSNQEKKQNQTPDLHSRGEFAPVVYTTIANGTWTGPNWTPAPPPSDLTNVAVVINHVIDYSTTVNINNWNKSDGSITVTPTGVLNVNTNGRSLTQSGGFTLINDGAITFDLGNGRYKIDGEGSLINSGTFNVLATKVEFKDRNYIDTNLVALVQVVNTSTGIMDMSSVAELHNDGYVSNSGMFIVGDLHNDGYICNSNVFQTNGNTQLHDNVIGYIGCGGELLTCNIEMDGGRLFNQDVCCMSGGVPSIVLVDSSGSEYQTGDYNYGSVTTNVCRFILATGISAFRAIKTNDGVGFYWTITDTEIGDEFIVQRSNDAIEFEDRLSVFAEENLPEGTFTAADDLVQGTVYYRLKVINASGADDLYSSIVSLTTESPGKEFTVYPNPSRDVFTISGELDVNSTVQLIDMNGKVVYNQIVNTEVSNFQVAHNLEVGVYILRISNNDVLLSTKKVVVQ